MIMLWWDFFLFGIYLCNFILQMRMISQWGAIYLCAIYVQSTYLCQSSFHFLECQHTYLCAPKSNFDYQFLMIDTYNSHLKEAKCQDMQKILLILIFSLPLIYLCNPEFKLKSWKALWWIYMYIALSMDEYRSIESNWCRVTEEIDGTIKSLQQWLRSNWERWFVENMIELQKKLILIKL